MQKKSAKIVQCRDMDFRRGKFYILSYEADPYPFNRDPDSTLTLKRALKLI